MKQFTKSDLSSSTFVSGLAALVFSLILLLGNNNCFLDYCFSKHTAVITEIYRTVQCRKIIH